MALLRLRRSAQITLPAALRKLFNLAEGILLRPVSIIEREKARKQLIAVMDRVHAKLPPSTQSAQEEEEEIAREIKEHRKAHA